MDVEESVRCKVYWSGCGWKVMRKEEGSREMGVGFYRNREKWKGQRFMYGDHYTTTKFSYAYLMQHTQSTSDIHTMKKETTKTITSKIICSKLFGPTCFKKKELLHAYLG